MSDRRTPVRPPDIRSHNLALVLRSVVQEPASRAEVAATTGLTKAAVSSLVDDLIERRLVAEDLPVVTGRGRPPRQLRLHPHSPTAVGLELNVDYVAAVRTTLAGHEVAAHRIDLDIRALPLHDVVQLLTTAWRAVTRPRGKVLGTGLAVAGVVDSSGTVLRASNVPVMSGVNIVETLATTLGQPQQTLTVDNEANLAALAELHEPGAEQSFVYVTGEIGVGSGIVIASELFRGVGGMAGELGHVSIEREGRQCGCGGRGCVEQYAGQEALLAASDSPTVEALVTAVRDGRPARSRSRSRRRYRTRHGSGQHTQHRRRAHRGTRRRVWARVRCHRPNRSHGARTTACWRRTCAFSSCGQHVPAPMPRSGAPRPPWCSERWSTTAASSEPHEAEALNLSSRIPRSTRGPTAQGLAPN